MAARKKLDEFGNEATDQEEAVVESAEQAPSEEAAPAPVVEEPAPAAPVEEPAPEPVVAQPVVPVITTKTNPVVSAAKLARDVARAHRPSRLGRRRCC